MMFNLFLTIGLLLYTINTMTQPHFKDGREHREGFYSSNFWVSTTSSKQCHVNPPYILVKCEWDHWGPKQGKTKVEDISFRFWQSWTFEMAHMRVPKKIGTQYACHLFCTKDHMCGWVLESKNPYFRVDVCENLWA